MASPSGRLLWPRRCAGLPCVEMEEEAPGVVVALAVRRPGEGAAADAAWCLGRD